MAKEGDPLVCRLLNHGKHIFDAKKQKAASKKKQKRQQIKEIKFRPVTEKNDYEIKVNKIKSFIENGDKAKITLRFRGREMAHQQIGMELLKRVESDLETMAPMLSRIRRSSRCRENGFIKGDIRKSFSVPPLIFQEGGCTPLGLKRVTKRTGEALPSSPRTPGAP